MAMRDYIAYKDTRVLRGVTTGILTAMIGISIAYTLGVSENNFWVPNFGLSNVIGGFIFGGAGILGAWGPAVAGYLRDIDGDYKHAFILCALTGGCSIVLFLLLPRPRQAS